MCGKLCLPQLFLHHGGICFNVGADIKLMAQGFDLFGQFLNLFLPRGAFRLLLLPVQNLALAGKLFDLIF